MPKIAYINSKYIKFNEAKIHIEDRGLQFADSVYEVVAIYKKHLVDFDFHIKRLKYSLIIKRTIIVLFKYLLVHDAKFKFLLNYYLRPKR